MPGEQTEPGKTQGVEGAVPDFHVGNMDPLDGQLEANSIQGRKEGSDQQAGCSANPQ